MSEIAIRPHARGTLWWGHSRRGSLSRAPGSMDVLSEILDAFHLTGVLYFRAELSAPFGVVVPEHEGAARFHIGVQGECCVRVDGDEEPRRIRRGDLLVVPHGRAHTLSDRPDRPEIGLDDAMARAGYEGEGRLVYGGGGVSTVLVCGHFAFERGVLHPLIDALPPLLHFPAGRGVDYRWLDHAMQFLGEEARLDRPGASAVVSRLSEILFIQVLRAWVEREGERAGPVAAIRDPYLGRALNRIHERPEHAWTVAALARVAGMSRTSFAERFHGLVGLTPMQYLTRWRIEKAKVALRSPKVAVRQIAQDVGYASEAAFCRAFKKYVGVGPATYRTHEAAALGGR